MADRQTDGRTDRQTSSAYAALHYVARPKKLINEHNLGGSEWGKFFTFSVSHAEMPEGEHPGGNVLYPLMQIYIDTSRASIIEAHYWTH